MVRERYARLGIAPYTGFVQPELVLVGEGGEVTFEVKEAKKQLVKTQKVLRMVGKAPQE